MEGNATSDALRFGWESTKLAEAIQHCHSRLGVAEGIGSAAGQ